VVDDLLHAIDQHWGQVLPAYMWDRKGLCFKGPVLLAIQGKAVLNRRRALEDGTTVKVMNSLAGG
jgi:hypothetical protein